jgi:CubicO group peptidase (beta-lactamase class C family)
MSTRVGVAVSLLLLIAVACGGGRAPTQSDPTGTLTAVAANGDWAAASPAEAGLDASRLTDLVRRIRGGQFGRIASLLVVRDGRLAVEEYFGGWTAAQPHTVQSVTKSVTSLLVGLAAQSGRLRLDDRVASFFPQYQPLAHADTRKDALTIDDLITMRSGLDWDESTYPGSPLQRLNDCRCDWLRFVLDWPMRDAPGTRWEYVSGATILLGGVVGAATGTRLDRFAADQLFGPLGVSGQSWIGGLPDGLPHAGGGLNLRPRDMAKLGQLVLDNGEWHGRPLVDANWIHLSASRVTGAARVWSGQTFDYGRGWWVTTARGGDVVTASGANGQWIFVVPSLRLVVVATGDNDDALWSAPVEFLYAYILPSVLT